MIIILGINYNPFVSSNHNQSIIGVMEPKAKTSMKNATAKSPEIDKLSSFSEVIHVMKKGKTPSWERRIKETDHENTGELDLHSSSLEDIGLLKLNHIETLDLSDNRIEVLKFNSQLPRLSWLDLSNNFLKHLPEDLGEILPNLERLNLSDNILEKLPVTLGRMDKLVWLNILRNPLDDVLWKLVRTEYLASGQEDHHRCALNLKTFFKNVENIMHSTEIVLEHSGQIQNLELEPEECQMESDEDEVLSFKEEVQTLWALTKDLKAMEMELSKNSFVRSFKKILLWTTCLSVSAPIITALLFDEKMVYEFFKTTLESPYMAEMYEPVHAKFLQIVRLGGEETQFLPLYQTPVEHPFWYNLYLNACAMFRFIFRV